MKHLPLVVIVLILLMSCTSISDFYEDENNVEFVAKKMQGVWVNSSNDTTALMFDTPSISDNSYEGGLYKHFYFVDSSFTVYPFYMDRLILYMNDDKPIVKLNSWHGIQRELKVSIANDQIMMFDHEIEYRQIKGF